MLTRRYCIEADLQRMKDEDKEDEEKSSNVVTGFGLRWDEVIDLGYIEETFEKGAFPKDTRQDTKMLIAHQPGIPLGNARSGTMRLWEDNKGLRFAVTLSENSQRAAEIIDAIDRGDLTDVSIGFTLWDGGEYNIDYKGRESDDDEKEDVMDRITITKVGTLAEISFVDRGAYSTAKIDGATRSFSYRLNASKDDEILKLYERDKLKQERRKFDELLSANQHLLA